MPGARGRCAADQFTQNSGPRERWCDLTGFEETGETIRTLKDAPQALQTKTADYRCVLPREYAEKPFSMTEDLGAFRRRAGDCKLVQYWLTPEITEQKLTGIKAVFKGVLVFKALLFGGGRHAAGDEPPASRCHSTVSCAEIMQTTNCRCRSASQGEQAELVHMEDEPAKNSVIGEPSLPVRCHAGL